MIDPKLDPSKRLEVRRQIRQHERYLIDTILPNGAFHIISGPSGIGKTTWWFQTSHDWEQGKSVLGFASHPCSWVYISLDRALQETDRTLRRIGLESWNIPCYNMAELIPRNGFGKIELEPHLDMIVERFPDVELYVIEGLQGLTPNTGRGQSQNKAELLFCMKMQDLILNKGKTVIAFTHSPKNSEYIHDRENMLGSQALIGAASTIINFDVPPDANGKRRGMAGQQQAHNRLVTVMGRDFPNIYLDYDRTLNGGFELSSKRTTPSESNSEESGVELFETHADKLLMLDLRLNSIPGNAPISRRDLNEWGRAVGLSTSSVDEWVKQNGEFGRILKEGAGKYRKSGTIQ